MPEFRHSNCPAILKLRMAHYLFQRGLGVKQQHMSTAVSRNDIY